MMRSGNPTLKENTFTEPKAASGLIPVTKNFRLGVVAATGGICLVTLIWLYMEVLRLLAKSRSRR